MKLKVKILKIFSKVNLALMAMMAVAAITFFAGPLLITKGPDLTLTKTTIPRPFSAKTAQKVVGVKIKTRLDSWALAKSKKHGWEVISPKIYPANNNKLNTLFLSLARLTPTGVFSDDALNRSSFSLEDPRSTIELTNRDGSKLTFDFGLENSIDGTVFLRFREERKIFQIERPSFDISKSSTTDFIDSSILNFNPLDIAGLKIIRNSRKNSKKQIHILDVDSKWQTLEGQKLSSDKVLGLLKKFKALKGHTLLDQTSKKSRKIIDAYLETPLYELVIEEKSGQSMTLQVSSLVKSIPELNLNKWENFIVRSSLKRHPYLLSKETLSLFNIRPRRLR